MASLLSNSDSCHSNKTIGIIGMSPVNVAQLNLHITKEISNAGINLDQDHPEILAVGLPTSSIRDLKSAAALCKDFGADVIAIAEKLQKHILRTNFSSLGVPVYAMTEDMQDMNALVTKVIARACKPHDAIRPDIMYSDDEKTELDLERDRFERDMRMRQREAQGGYTILKTFRGKFVGVLGGAGPLASSAFLQKCTDFGVPFICYSNTSAPSKNDFETGAGPSYIGHYRNSCYFFALLQPGVFVITCNTAHMRLELYLEPYQCLHNVFVDIRSGIIGGEASEVVGDKFIILGTSRTSGVGLPDGEPGLYEQYRRKSSPESNIIVCNAAQQRVISSAIVDAKAGRFSCISRPEIGPDGSVASQAEDSQSYVVDPEDMFAREKILSVVNELRLEYGDIPVVFGCTELPLPFSMVEMSHYGFYDPAQRLVEAVRHRLESTASKIS